MTAFTLPYLLLASDTAASARAASSTSHTDLVLRHQCVYCTLLLQTDVADYRPRLSVRALH